MGCSFLMLAVLWSADPSADPPTTSIPSVSLVASADGMESTTETAKPKRMLPPFFSREKESDQTTHSQSNAGIDFTQGEETTPAQSTVSNEPLENTITESWDDGARGRTWIVSPPSPAPGPERWYAKADFIYWQATDPRRKAGLLLSRTSTIGVAGATTQTSDLDEPNTNNEMGFRALFGRKINDRFGIEGSALWANRTMWIETFDAAVQTGNAFNPNQITITTVTVIPTGEGLNQAIPSFQSRYWGLEANGRWRTIESSVVSVDAIAGLRYMNYAERWALEYRRTATSPSFVERFDTDNDMVGGQIGGDVRLALLEYVSLEGIGRAGFMGNFGTVHVKGPANGILTRSSNLGAQSNTDFTMLFEVGGGVLIDLTPHIALRLGYSGIWFSDQLRSADQIDLAAVSTPGGIPIVSFERDDMWIYGYTASLACRW